ncbi:MAG: hypothetical protein IKM99_09665 [Bacteroidales bacterium]|nr:hypothetical protein [Bacteroidales bacterium]
MNRIILLFSLWFVSLSVVASATDSLTCHYSWNCDGHERNCSVTIDKQLLDYYRRNREHLAYRYDGMFSENQGGITAYYGFMFSEKGRKTVRQLAAQVADTITSDVGRIKQALTFVQSLPYVLDEESKGREEYVRYPLETIADGKGDCEDKAVLLGALLHEMGIDFVLLSVPDHVALGVRCDSIDSGSYLEHDGKRYYYLETTASGWEIGQIPEQYNSTVFELAPIRMNPIVMVKGVSFESEPTLVFRKANCALKMDFMNAGPTEANGLRLHVLVTGYNHRKDKVMLDELFPLDDMLEGEEKSQTIRFQCMVDKDSVIQITVMGDDIAEQYFEMKLNQRNRRGRY